MDQLQCVSVHTDGCRRQIDAVRQRAAEAGPFRKPGLVPSGYDELVNEEEPGKRSVARPEWEALLALKTSDTTLWQPPARPPATLS
ncbi:hypothetical protein ACIBG4_04650 [Nonomuraea sp. NPDC050383]|uniref:hypothetical protein n=1 Tax=Nonomuraea sp. NPDC050383 TaxID=3364362 RepID=UPI0037A35C00